MTTILKKVYFIVLIIAIIISVQACTTISNCQTCAIDPNVCQQCQVSYVLIDNQCLVCQAEFCQTCSSQSQYLCQTCMTNYILYDQHCYACQVQNCQTCTNYDVYICQTCSIPYVLSQDGQCIQCQVYYCQQCSSNDQYLCQTCQPGFLNHGDYCQDLNLCPYGQRYNGVDCQCQQLSYRHNGQCISCNNDICADCNSTNCLLCNWYYYLDGEQCKQCMEGCVDCYQLTVCLQCQFPYILSQNNTCVIFGNGQSAFSIPGTDQIIRCPVGCHACELDQQSKLICTSAGPGYAIIKGKITQCFIQCKTCSQDDQTKCLSCLPGYVLITNINQNTSQCILCTQEGIAETCSPQNPDISLTCFQGYVKEQNQDLCKPCAPNCQVCNNNGANKCDLDKCSYGYYFDEQNMNCSLCLNGCSECKPDNPSKCTGCSPGTYNSTITGYCQTCLQNCLKCKNDTSCDQCIKGYTKKVNRCLKTPQFPIQSYSDDGLSFQCFFGYKVQNNTCVFDKDRCANNTNCTVLCQSSQAINGICQTCNLSDGCKRCKKTKVRYNCVQCKIGYYLNNQQCFRCRPGCFKCTHKANCLQNLPGYYIKQGSRNSPTGNVLRCKPPCKTCVQNQNKCLSCIQGYEQDESSCFSLKKLLVQIIYNPIDIFNLTDNDTTKLSKIYKNNAQIRKQLCLNMDPQLKGNDDQQCSKSLKILNYTVVQILQIDQYIDGNSFRYAIDAIEAARNSMLRDIGKSKVSATQLSVSAIGYDQYAPKDYRLIIGLSVGGGVLVILGVFLAVFCYYRRKKLLQLNNNQIKDQIQIQNQVSPSIIAQQTGAKLCIDKVIQGKSQMKM